MVFLNAWILFAFIPLYFLYQKGIQKQNTRQIRLLFISLAFMLLTFARPALQNSFTNEKFDSEDYIIAIDASYSMQADDLKPTRFVMAKNAIKKLFELHPKDRFTLFAFTSNALLISPPTTDTQISMQALNALNPKYILTKSTNLYNLFETVAKVSLNKKNLIIFSDGGDEHNIIKLSKIIQANNIKPFFLATATKKGAALKKDGAYLKNQNEALVVSRINPLLEDLANATDGKYYTLNSLDVIDRLSSDLTTQSNRHKLNITVKKYKELFFIPLIFAIILYFISITKIHQLYIFIPLFIFPYKANAGILDFFYLNHAQQSYKQANYIEAAQNFQELTPSVQSYYNIANAYYKAKHYKKALSYYTQIETGNRKIKQAILYNIGNCAFKLKKYNEAKKFYIQALGLGDDTDALHNLNIIKKMHLKQKKDIQNLMPHKNRSKKKKREKDSKSKKDNNKKDSAGSSNSNRSSQQSSNGKGGNKKKKSVSRAQKSIQKNNFKMGYKAYEKINKGYSNEKEPW